ncbi:MAG TPA: hypothetical protein VFX48_04795 [Saprospiraceae bacterium]|nr:hypothetical protein [Saprospiraceae bacterium]
MAQTKLGFDELYFNLGTTINLYYKGGSNFPGIKAFVGVGGNKHIYSQFGSYMLNVGLNLGIYNKSLGNSLVLLNQDNQIDFTSSFHFGPASTKKDLPYSLFKNARSINNLPFYNLRFDNHYLALLGINFILNNHVRHQTVGSILLNYDRVTLQYYNDGGFPLRQIGLGDNFDRWWTGGGGIYWHSRDKSNILEFTFDQFTGYERQYFELATLLGMDVQDYSLFQGMDAPYPEQRYNIRGQRAKINYNSSSYNLRAYLNDGFALNLGVIGSLRSGRNENERLWGIQDLIHKRLRIAIHPNYDINRWAVGLSFNHLQKIK